MAHNIQTPDIKTPDTQPLTNKNIKHGHAHKHFITKQINHPLTRNMYGLHKYPQKIAGNYEIWKTKNIKEYDNI